MKSISLVLFSIIGSLGFAQTIIDIEVDEITFMSDRIEFTNYGEVDRYECTIGIAAYRDYDHGLVLNCTWEMFPHERKKALELEEIKNFRGIKQLNYWLKDKKFESDLNSVKENYKSYLQYLDANFFVHYSYEYMNRNRKWQLKNVYFLDYVYLRINKKYLIVCLLKNDKLVRYENPRIMGFIVPSQNGDLVSVEGYRYYNEGEPIDSTDFSREIDVEEFFRIKREEGKEWLYDRLFQEKIIDKSFKKIVFGRNYIICKDDRGTTIYDKTAQTPLVSDALVAHDFKGLVQFIKKDRTQWLDREGVILDTFPFPLPNWDWCGTTTPIKRILYGTEQGFYESYDIGYNMICRDSLFIVSQNNTESIKYLDNSVYHEYDEYSDFYSVFQFPYNYYIIEKENNKQLVSIVNGRDSIEEKLIVERGYSFKESKKKDSLTNLIHQLEDDIDLKFQGDFKSFGYYHPIKFREENLFGYYPQNKKAKYRTLEEFDFFYAKFTCKNGRKGWLDIYGNEHFRK